MAASNDDSSNNLEDTPMKLPPFTEIKADGHYRYRRRVPKKLVALLGKERLYRNLGKTYDSALSNWPAAHQEIESLFSNTAVVAEKQNEREKVLLLVANHFGTEAAELLAAGQIDETLSMALWDFSDTIEGKVSKTTQAQLANASLPEEVVTLGDVLDAYYEGNTSGSAAKDHRQKTRLERCKTDLVAALGRVKVYDLSHTEITRKNANAYRDHLLKRLSPSSVLRNKNAINAALNWYLKEHGLELTNPFNGMLVKNAGASKDDRLPLSDEDLLLLNETYRDTDAEVYYLLLRETGLRVSELAGIQVGDVSLQDRSLHVQPNDIRGLKTKGSQRVIPLSDASLAALQQHRQGKDDRDPVFPRYARTNGNTSLSAMMMKHFRKAITDPKKSLHSLRHRMKDALRNTGCGDELGKSILGHTTSGVSARYGSGHSVGVMREALEKVW